MRKFRVTLWTCQICAHFMHLASTKCKMLSVMPRWIQHSLGFKICQSNSVFWEILAWSRVSLWMSWHCSCGVSFLTLIGLYTKKLHAFKLWKHILVCVQFFVIQYNVGVWQARKVLRKKRNKKGLKYLLIEQRQDKSDKIKQ